MSKSEATSKIRKRSPNPSPPAFVDTFPAHIKLHQAETDQTTTHAETWRQASHPKPRPQSPALPWHKEYSQLDPRCGRVLVIDFLRADQSSNRKRKVVAQELDCLDSLRKLYKHPRRSTDENLRLLHVQNAPWATKFLLRKFNIDGRDDLVGSNFGRYARFTKPDRRGGKPFPNAKTWRVQHDPWRGIGKTSFGFEYLKEYRVDDPTAEGRIFDEKMMELNGYDDEENPVYGYDVYIQRLACYIQHKEDPPSPPFDGVHGISNPYKVQRPGQNDPKSHRRYLPQLSTLDNEDAIIIFDNSQSGSFEDCLIPARSEWETHWRRLPFYLAYEARELIGNDDLLGRQCARMILDDVFRALIHSWESLLDASHIHVSILEDKIYEQPADETRAPELWRNSSLWLSLEKLTTAHMSVVREMRVRLRELVADITRTGGASQSHSSGGGGEVVGSANDDDWLEQVPGDLERIASTLDEDLVKPTQSLISLLYQSVSIRDSRLSLQIDTSMWRLSWVTFIFLPLTFMVGFFGMNVDTFAGNPSMKWYFIVSVPFMFLVLAGWYIMKHILARQRQTPYQRGIYESFFHSLAVRYPKLWSRLGPRDSIVPRTRLDRWKWWLIKRWTRSERTIKAGQPNADTAATSLSRWSKIKMALIRHWTDRLTTFGSPTDVESLDMDDETDIEQGSALAEGLFGATELLTVPGQPVASAMIEKIEERREAQDRHPATKSRPDGADQNDDGNRDTSATAYGAGEVSESSFLPIAFASEGPIQYMNADSQVQRGSSPVGYRANSNSPRGRPKPRPTSSAGGSSDSRSRHSSVLVEEEDPRWINQLGKQGRGWYWRPASQSPGGEGRRSSGGSTTSPGGRPTGIRVSIDERVGGGSPSPPLPPPPPPPSTSGGGSGGGTPATLRPSEEPFRGPSPLGIMIANTQNLGQDSDGVQASQQEERQSATATPTGPSSPPQLQEHSTPVPHRHDNLPEPPPPSENNNTTYEQQQQQRQQQEEEQEQPPTAPSASSTATTNTSSDEAVKAAAETGGRGDV